MDKTIVPNLIRGGLPKSGTTYLYNILSQHNEICASSVKEIALYMSVVRKNKRPDLSLYKKYFDHYKTEKYLLEASPQYFFNTKIIAPIIRDDFSKLKLIFCFRNPTDHLFSLYKNGLRSMRIKMGTSFDEDFKRRKYYPGLNNKELLIHWIECFEENNIKVIFFENLISNTAEEITNIFNWLDIDISGVGNFKTENINMGGIPKSIFLQKLIKIIFGAQTKEYIPHKLEMILRKMIRINMTDINIYTELTDEIINEINILYHDSKIDFSNYLKKIGYDNHLPKWLQSVL